MPFAAGERLTANELNTALTLSVAKGADTARSLTTALAADPDLTVAVLANSLYVVRFSLPYKGAATGTGDLKFGFSVPPGATFAGGFIGVTNPLGVYLVSVTASSTLISYGNGTGNPLWCEVTATLTTSATAGNLTLTWAQNTSNATATTLMAGSSLQVTVA